MLALRSFCLWVLMLALPLQGFAAASMRFCGSSPSTPSAMAAVAGAQQSGVHDHSAHAGHASHPPAAQHDPASLAELSFAQRAAAHAASGMPDHGIPTHDTLNHKCALCAGCCHAMALLPFFTPLEFGPLAHADPAEPLVLIQAMPVRVPEKPPRA